MHAKPVASRSRTRRVRRWASNPLDALCAGSVLGSRARDHRSPDPVRRRRPHRGRACLPRRRPARRVRARDRRCSPRPRTSTSDPSRSSSTTRRWLLWRDDAGSPRVARTGTATTPEPAGDLDAHRGAGRRSRHRPGHTGGAAHRWHARSSHAVGSRASWTGGWCCAACSTAGRCSRPAAIAAHDGASRGFIARRRPASVLGSFLREHGYLHLRGVYDEHEMATIATDMDTCAPTHTEGDGRSWWATVADGTRRVVRMQGFDRALPRRRRAARRRPARPHRRDRRRGPRAPHRDREPHRGAVQADRRDRRDLRRAVAQGLQPRPAQLRVLRAHHRHLGHRRRRRARGSCT